MYDGRQTAGIYVDSYMLRYEYAFFYETPKPSIYVQMSQENV